MKTLDTDPQTTPEDKFSKLHALRLGVKITSTAAKIVLTRPVFIFKTPLEVMGLSSEATLEDREAKRANLADRVIVDVASWQLPREIGSLPQRLRLVDSLAEIRSEQGFPAAMSVQEMADAMK